MGGRKSEQVDVGGCGVRPVEGRNRTGEEVGGGNVS